MSRLDTVRQYFIEQFVGAIGKAVGTFPGLSHPAELFTGGVFNVTPDAAGFQRIPTLDRLAQRIAAATDPTEKSNLQTFVLIVVEETRLLTFGLGPIRGAELFSLAQQYAPQIRQEDTISFWPMAVEQYLNYDDGTLKGYYYDPSGRTPLRGRVFDVMFQNPSIPFAADFPQAPYQQRVPFVATVGIDPSVPPYPISPLNVGQLNLSAADVRLYPGVVKPVLYAELKAIRGSLTINRDYQAAATSGRFADLRNNRLHEDPAPAVLPSTLPLGRADDPVLLLYHAFYPIDDEVRKTQGVEATDREGHHLAAGILLRFPALDFESKKEARVSLGELFKKASAERNVHFAAEGHPKPTHFFFCAGPDDVRILPFNHPSVQLLGDQPGGPGGSHVILYAGWGTPLRLQLDQFFSSTAVTISSQDVSTADLIMGGLIIAATAASYCAAVAAGTVVGLPVAAVCLVVAVVLWVLALLLFLACLFFLSCGKPESSNPPPDQYQPNDPSTDPKFQNVGTYLAPPGTSLPGRAFDLKLIPHAMDQNLYGLQGGSGATFTIEDDPGVQEMLGWVAFPGGLGYQVDRQMPGKSDRPGSQWRDYYSLFIAKIAELEQAQSLVSYFGP
jgi:hypothetical protein